jgi:hypothetical protein
MTKTHNEITTANLGQSHATKAKSVPAFVAALKKVAGEPAVTGAVAGSYTRWLAD